MKKPLIGITGLAVALLIFAHIVTLPFYHWAHLPALIASGTWAVERMYYLAKLVE